MKKRGCMLTVVIVLLLMMAIPTSAMDTAFVVKLPQETLNAGDTFEVTVELSGNPGFCAIQFVLPYDETKMECTELEVGPLVEGTLYSSNPNAKSGAIVAAATLNPVKEDGIVAMLTFTAKAKISNLDLSLNEAMLADEAGNSMDFTVRVEKQPGTTPTDPEESGEPTEPAEPDEPGESTDPTEPDEPDEPAEPERPSFTDTAGHWAEDYIVRSAQLGLFKGYPDGRFGPDDAVTRAQYVTVLYRLAGSPAVDSKTPFTDLSGQSQEFQNAIAWGYANGYINGRTSTIFDPNGNITRQEAMKIMFYYSGGKSGMEVMFTSIYDANYTDSGKIASWAKPAMYWGVYNEIISGTTNTTLAPDGTATRAQLAKILVNYIEQFES